MKSMISSLLSFFIVVTLTGCAKFHCYQMVQLPDLTKEIDNPQMARLYVMRDTILADESTIRDGDQFIGILTAHHYLCWERKPGKAVISTMYGSAKKFTNELELNVQSGSVYYIHEHSFWPLISLERIDEQEGKMRLERCDKPRVNAF